MKRLKNIHPGEILQEEFLIPLKIKRIQVVQRHKNSTNKNIGDIEG